MLLEKIFLDLKKEGAQAAASRDLHVVEGLDAYSLCSHLAPLKNKMRDKANTPRMTKVVKWKEPVFLMLFLRC